MKHKVRTHSWVNGLLKTVEKEFDELEDAIEHANNITAHVVKVIDELGETILSRFLEVIPEQLNVRDEEDGYSYP